MTRDLVKAVITHEMTTGYDFPIAEARGIAEAYYAPFYLDERLPTPSELLDIACEVMDHRTGKAEQ